MKRFFTKINHTFKSAKNIPFIEENNQPESVTAPKFSVLINPENKTILNQRNENLKYIFNTLREYEVKLDPYSVGDIYRYHMLRQEVELSYKTSTIAKNVLQDNIEPDGPAQLVGEVNTVEINASVD